ncbi:hypothetical protein O971_03465 [Mycobacterium avium subsp. hominissuis 10-4249]|nr:hypothetical protein O971_03465 [Mycobacterium avium subsp. hominissuis 10-4249]KDO94251.1 hypothetical protein MAVA5_17565 [Mycobacterium avium subsp. hominissuis A5]
MDLLLGSKPAVSESFGESGWRWGLWLRRNVIGHSVVDPLLGAANNVVEARLDLIRGYTIADHRLAGHRLEALHVCGLELRWWRARGGLMKPAQKIRQAARLGRVALAARWRLAGRQQQVLQ